MKVRISYTIDAPDWFRREINRYYDKPGLATREEVRAWFKQYGSSMDDDLAMQAGWESERENERSKVE
jgi:hypothetical protein